MKKIHTELTPSAAAELTEDEVQQVVSTAVVRAQAQKGWKRGKSFELGFTNAGVRYMVAIDWRRTGLHALIGREMEVRRVGQPDSN